MPVAALLALSSSLAPLPKLYSCEGLELVVPEAMFATRDTVAAPADQKWSSMPLPQEHALKASPPWNSVKCRGLELPVARHPPPAAVDAMSISHPCPENVSKMQSSLPATPSLAEKAR